MAQSGGCPQEALGSGQDTAADCRLRLTHRTEDIAWPGTQKKKKCLAPSQPVRLSQGDRLESRTQGGGGGGGECYVVNARTGWSGGSLLGLSELVRFLRNF